MITLSLPGIRVQYTTLSTRGDHTPLTWTVCDRESILPFLQVTPSDTLMGKKLCVSKKEPRHQNISLIGFFSPHLEFLNSYLDLMRFSSCSIFALDLKHGQRWNPTSRLHAGLRGLHRLHRIHRHGGVEGFILRGRQHRDSSGTLWRPLEILRVAEHGPSSV